MCFERFVVDNSLTLLLAWLYSICDFIPEPEIVINLQKVSSTSDSITISWSSPMSGSFTRFKVTYCDGDAASIRLVLRHQT